MSEWNFNHSDEEDNEDEETLGVSQELYNGRDAVIFLIDASEAMFQKEMDDDSSFEIAIKCAKQTLQNKIIGSDKDLFGIVFYATKKSTSEDFKNVFLYQEIGLPGAERVLELEKLLEDNSNDDFGEKYGHSTSYNLSDALWTCLNVFSNCSQKLIFKRIFLFTNNDNPHENQDQIMKQTLAKVGDLRENGINLILMHMNRSQKKFNYELFYKELLANEAGDQETDFPDSSERFEEMLTRVRKKIHKKRAVAKINFYLTKDFFISIGIYNLVRSCYKPACLKLYKNTNEELKCVTKTYLKENGELLSMQDMKKCQTYGGRSICLTNEEALQLKTITKPGLFLVGFKPKTSIKSYFHVKTAQFIYPDEQVITGSIQTFTALLKQCLDKGVVAICQFVPHKSTPPKFVALWPQEEELNEAKVQIIPSGFHLLYLPYSDDFRKVPIEPNQPRASKVQIDKAKEMVKKLQFGFNSESFENPFLQQFYSHLEAMALEKDAPEEVQDFTQPDEEKIEKRAGKWIEEFKQLVYTESNLSSAMKKGGSSDQTKVDLEKTAHEGKLGRLTVAVLKEWVRKLNIKCLDSKKAEIIEAINEHYGI